VSSVRSAGYCFIAVLLCVISLLLVAEVSLPVRDYL
jgi:hypothetical protein